MSGLEDAAAAHAQRSRQAADSAARNRAEAQKARQQAAALLREGAREFFDFARDHGAPALPLYLHGSIEHDGPYAPIDEPCVTAAAGDRFGFTGSHFGQWAVTSDGGVYHHARIDQRRRSRDAQLFGIHDEVFVVVNMRSHDTVRNRSHDMMRPHFVAAAAALLDAVPVPGAADKLVGVQGDGLIGYLL